MFWAVGMPHFHSGYGMFDTTMDGSPAKHTGHLYGQPTHTALEAHWPCCGANTTGCGMAIGGAAGAWASSSLDCRHLHWIVRIQILWAAGCLCRLKPLQYRSTRGHSTISWPLARYEYMSLMDFCWASLAVA